MPETAKCTLCAAVESPGFYTGCMIADGHGGNGWACDGKGNLTRRATIKFSDIPTTRSSDPALWDEDSDTCAACGEPKREHQQGGKCWGPLALCSVFIPPSQE